MKRVLLRTHDLLFRSKLGSVITDAVARNTSLSNGSFGWQGAFGTHFWVDPKEKLIGLLMVQTSNQEMIRDFENAVLQSIVE